MEGRIEHIEKLIKKIFGEHTDSRRAFVAYSPNRHLVHPVVLNYIVTIYVNEIDRESDNSVCRRLLKELKKTKENIESDICKLKDKINKKGTKNE